MQNVKIGENHVKRYERDTKKGFLFLPFYPEGTNREWMAHSWAVAQKRVLKIHSHSPRKKPIRSFSFPLFFKSTVVEIGSKNSKDFESLFFTLHASA